MLPQSPVRAAVCKPSLLSSFPLIVMEGWTSSARLKAAAPTWYAETKDVEAMQDRSFLTAEFDKHQDRRMAEEEPEFQTQHCDCRARADIPFDSTQLFHQKRFYSIWVV